MSFCSLAAWAYSFSAVSPTGQTLYYNITSSTVPLTVEVANEFGTSPYYTTKPTGNLTIPSSVTYSGNTYSVTTIGNYAFSGCNGLTSVIIPNTVISIGINAFYNCSSLSSVTIPSSVTSIGSYAFAYCSNLANVTIPDLVTEIAANTFYHCDGLSSISLPNSLTFIGNASFAYCSSLTSVEIPDLVTSIGSSAFWYCSSLIDVTIGTSVSMIGNEVFDNCTSLTSIVIPSSVLSIGQYAFNGCSSLAKVVFSGDNLQSIGNYAFSSCTLNGITIPSSVWSIGGYAFNGIYTVSYCGSTSAGKPWGAIRVGCFYEEDDFLYQDETKTCLLAYTGVDSIVSIPNTVTTIDVQAFRNKRKLRNVNIPNTVTTIGGSAFYNCSGLTSVTIPNSVTTIGSSAFLSCSGLKSVTIGNSVASVGSYAFQSCRGLTSLIIPNSVTSIGDYAFYNCSGLTSVIIGNSITNIWSSAFSGCTDLKTVYNLSNLTFTKGDYSNGSVAKYAYRVVDCTEHSGFGDNIIYKIPATFTIVDNDASTSETEIPYSSISTNFLYYDNSAKDGGSWKAKNIVLTDGQDAFESPETFTAETATYTREFTNNNRSTLYLPFTASIPSDLEVYDFTNFANNTISFTEHTGDIAAYTPYLVGYDLSKDGNTTTCTITKTNAVFPKSESANYHPVTHDDMTFSGVISRTRMTSTNNYGYSNGFFVQSGGSAHVNPFRCYFTYTPSGNAPQSLPPSLNVEVGYGDPVGIDAVETPEQEYDGRYGKDVYDMLGRLVRKNADSLEGLPQGIYIWKGRKYFNN